MRWLIVAAAVTLWLAAPAAAESRWAFSTHDVLIHQTRLQYTFNSLFPQLAPVPVQCTGQRPVKLRSGANGFYLIDCIIGLNAPDFVYRLDDRGREHMSRVREP